MTRPEKKDGHGGSTHSSVPNAKNASILVGIRDGVTGDFKLVPRPEAVVSVFDSNFLIGDGIWEGIRANKGRLQFARDHINRLFQSAKAMFMDLGLSKGDLLDLIHQTLDANDMGQDEHVHIRLVVSRGLKSTPYQNPSVNIGLPLIVIIPESKAVDPNSKSRGLRLATTWVRRGPPDVKDEQWNHISKATDVQACIHANIMNVDEALMLDLRGFVKTCNSVNFFIVRGDEVWAPTKDNQMQGITRQKTIDVCRANGITVKELDFTLTEVYGADEAFCTGTFPSQIHVTEVDGRVIGDGKRGVITERIQQLYAELVRKDVERSRDEIRAEVASQRDLTWLKAKFESLVNNPSGTILTAIPSRDGKCMADDLLETIQNSNLGDVFTSEDLMKHIVQQTVTFTERFRVAGLGEHVLDIFENELASEVYSSSIVVEKHPTDNILFLQIDREAGFFNSFTRKDWNSRYVNNAISEAAGCTWRVKDIRGELRLIDKVFTQQLDVLKEIAPVIGAEKGMSPELIKEQEATLI
ncbi:hypothetical protein FAUST_10536 [Fusarium austroamericanum]|uniref:Uncharacterized protein n=1 Tax=Fusarium austroamericanum TaxID=282268 RepID=A0AAN5Z0T4_FUSAU|nr:hypothetical protein FAUST_10536 [Fusarium austroamericanum]